jgi:hypothetical protein
MKDPKRLIDDGNLGAFLLAAAREDAPRPHARARTNIALGLASGTATVTATAKAIANGSSGAAVGGTVATVTTKIAATSLSLKLAAAAAIVVGVGSGAVVFTRGAPEPIIAATIDTASPSMRTTAPPPATGPTTTKLVSSAATPDPVSVPDPVLTVPVTASRPTSVPVTSKPVEHAPPKAAPRTSAAASASPSEGTAETSLLKELNSLDSARAALGRGDARGALVLLDRHSRTFPSGSLAAEASMLRVEALLAGGERQAARALAIDLLAKDPSGPHAKRLRTVANLPD